MAGHAGLLDGFVTPLAHISDVRGMMVCYRHAGTNLEQFVEQHSLTNFEKKQLFCQLLMHLEQLHAMVRAWCCTQLHCGVHSEVCHARHMPNTQLSCQCMCWIDRPAAHIVHLLFHPPACPACDRAWSTQT